MVPRSRMTHSQKYLVIKYASNLGGLVGHLATDSFLPASTYTRTHDGQGWRGAGAGVTTDLSRGVGGLLGMTALKGLENSQYVKFPTAPGARTALMIAALASGSLAGHYRGKGLGEQIFHPGTFMDRLHHATKSF